MTDETNEYVTREEFDSLVDAFEETIQQLQERYDEDLQKIRERYNAEVHKLRLDLEKVNHTIEHMSNRRAKQQEQTMSDEKLHGAVKRLVEKTAGKHK